MRALLAILASVRRSFRGSLSARLAVVIGLSALAGTTAGVLPAVVGIAMNSVLGRPAPRGAGIAGTFGSLVAGAAVWQVLAATLVATLATVLVSVVTSKLGSQLSGEVTAALRVELLRAVMHASPRAVDDAGRAMGGARRAGGPAPPGAKVPEVRGAEMVKLAIARESGLAAEFTLAVATGLPQAVFTLGVLGFELVAGGTWLVLGGGLGLFVVSRLAADRASRRVAREMHGMQQADAAIFSSLGELLAATEDLGLLGARRQVVAEFAEAAYHCADARRRFTSALAIAEQIKNVFSAMAPLLILVALLVSGRSHDAGDVAKLLLVVPLLMGRLEALDALRTGLIERAPVLDATVRLLGLPEHPPPPADPASASELVRGAIEFDDVTFTPPGAAGPVLDGLSLSVPAGAVVGVCGPSGCGKSTLLRVLLRLDDPSSGSVRIDDVDVTRLPSGELPHVFAVLGQASRLLERSVADNLAMGLEPPPTEDAMHDKLSRVKLDELAAPAGARNLTTTYRAVPPNFSGGELRRFFFARMLVRDSRVLVLDELEAGLPSATAEEILRAVAELARGRTCLVVTHAPHLLASTFNVVLDRGKVAAQGTHDELCASSELYRSLLAESLKPGTRPAGVVHGPPP